MTVNGHPQVIEGPGRYAVYQSPDGGWVVARAVDICDTCRSCGCGEQADPIQIPAMVIKLAMSQGNGSLMRMLGKAARRG